VLDQNQLDPFLNWIRTFDYRLLLNEDDVETKFVLSLFQYLGYPEECRRGKYPLQTYSPGKPGRKPEIDQVYFAVKEPDKQNADTSLVIVEAKGPQETNLDKDVNQAKFYGYYLKPSFLVVTNGYQLKILKCHRHRSEEFVFDDTVDALRDREIATDIYNQLNFEIVKHVKECTANVLIHAQYVQLAQALRRYPDLQDILDKGDFQPFTGQVENLRIVVKPKVAVMCNLPIAFEEGSCQIDFSSVTRRGLTIHLTHQNILGDLMMGLHTSPHWQTRRFLRQIDDDLFEAQLGQTTTILSEEEAYDLCACIDEVCQEYKRIIIEAENVLETWDYEPLHSDGLPGFYLLSVRQWLWELMRKFAHEFDCGRGNSDWHTFKQVNILIRVGRGFHDHAFIWPKTGINSWSLLPTGYVHLVCVFSDRDLRWVERGDVVSWKQAVGPQGIWTARYTKKWILEDFIPKVRAYYARDYQAHQCEPYLDIRDDYQTKHIPFREISEPKQIAAYLHAVQLWLHCRPSRITVSTLLLRPYYAAFRDLAQQADPSTINISYIAENLRAVEAGPECTRDKTESRKSPPKYQWTYDDVMNSLDQHVARINQSEYEDSSNADLISRAFIAIVQEGAISFSQAQLNAAKQALLPLWEQSRFEWRYVLPNQ